MAARAFPERSATTIAPRSTTSLSAVRPTWSRTVPLVTIASTISAGDNRSGFSIARSTQMSASAERPATIRALPISACAWTISRDGGRSATSARAPSSVAIAA